MPNPDNPWAPPVFVPHEQIAAAAHYVTPPDPSRKAYCVAPTGLSFYPNSDGFQFKPGDELQDVLPADILAECVRRGDVSYDKPKGSR
jgi:hypothetical protein